jgi:putative addiction module killer protein
VIEVRQTAEFRDWLADLRDRQAAIRIVSRLRRVERGALGDSKSVGEGVHELRVDHGPGYRLYFVWRGNQLIVLICGGDKSSQDRDIKTAHRLAKAL